MTELVLRFRPLESIRYFRSRVIDDSLGIIETSNKAHEYGCVPERDTSFISAFRKHHLISPNPPQDTLHAI